MWNKEGIGNKIRIMLDKGEMRGGKGGNKGRNKGEQGGGKGGNKESKGNRGE